MGNTYWIWKVATMPWHKSWTHKKTNNKKAALWLIGRGDGFNHPHVAKELFFGKGMDLYVLNWCFNGRCLNCYYNSHNPCGDIDVYNEEVALILDLIRESGPYETVLGYAHSTGASILLK